MKIRLNTPWGDLNVGEIVECIKNPLLDQVIIFDSSGLMWYLNQSDYDEVQEEAEEVKPAVISIRDMFGQDLSGITFK